MWKKLDSNEVLQGEGYYISYCPNTNKEELGQLLNILGSKLTLGKFEADGRAETALCIKETETTRRKFFILNGDFRKDYEKCQTVDDCFKVFRKNTKYRSNWSDKE